mmetsp:Transcript_11978/g.25167  ORF Transcript_11978/g.25167 Transcript_11978/m.25167 type:complete len:437 (+) Transcript_11978:306-1616(+)
MGVGVKHGLVLAGNLHAQVVVRVGFRGMEVEDEEVVAALEGDHLPLVVHSGDRAVPLHQKVCLRLQFEHVSVELLQFVVEQRCVVSQVPSSPGIFEAIAVGLAGEVDPVRVAELVPHEGEVPPPADAHGEQADHLVQRDAAVDAVGGGPERAHAVVHVGVHEPEGNRLGPHQRLVVALGVPDGRLERAAVLHAEHQVAHVPAVVVDPLLHHLHPLVGDGHLQAVVEPDAALDHGAAEGGHAGHVLGDGDALRVERVQHVVGEHEVRHALHVGVHSEVLPVVARELVLQTVVGVHHGGDAVEAEAVELVLLHPPTQIGQKEAHGLILAIVEAAAVPHPVITLRTRVEKVAIGAIEHVDPVGGVAGGMAVHNVHEHDQAIRVSRVDEILELIGRPAAARDREEIRHVVPERTVERVLLDRHQLNRVVPHLRGPRDDIA